MKGSGQNSEMAAEVKYAQGSPHHEGLPYLVPVPEGIFFKDSDGTEAGLEAEPLTPTWSEAEVRSPQRTDQMVDYYWWDGVPPVEIWKMITIQWNGPDIWYLEKRAVTPSVWKANLYASFLKEIPSFNGQYSSPQ